MGHKRHDGLARPVAVREERRHRRRDRGPPTGRADENHVVRPDIGQPAFQRRADAAADLFLGLIHDGSVFGGVGRGRNDLEKIAARRFGDLPRHGARIAAVGEIGHQHLRAGCGLRLCIHIG